MVPGDVLRPGKVAVIGGGLAGCEATWRLARHGVEVDLYEMKPGKFSEAHQSSDLAELVCSNSLRSNDLNSAVGLLKEEMRRLGSLTMEAAAETRVPAGKALAVDRDAFSAWITSRIMGLEGVRLIREEADHIGGQEVTVLATGPLTSPAMASTLAGIIQTEHLYFYDSVAPIVTAESVDRTTVFQGSRYEDPGVGDYWNCPMNEEEYHTFYQALISAEMHQGRDFEKLRFFEGCLPIEVMAQRGIKTLTFGPLKPVGLIDPRIGQRPHAVVQLRKENLAGTLFNLVGFQTRLKKNEQDRVFRLIPGLENAEFSRYGSMHRNTFIRSPEHLSPTLTLTAHPHVFLAGQISGVEGYVESAAMGILAGENAARLVLGRPLVQPPPITALGALVGHLTDRTPKDFQPSNINFGLLPPVPRNVPKKNRPAFHVRRALDALDRWKKETGV